MANDRSHGRTVRLSTKLLQEAAIHGEAWKRSTAQQIEFWASIGRAAAPFLSPNDIVAIGQGLARIKIAANSPTTSPSMPFGDIAPMRDPRLMKTVARAPASPKDIRELLGLECHSGPLESDMDVVNLLEGGLPRKCIDTLVDRAGFAPVEICRVIHITEKTLRLWRSGAENHKLLTPLQSSLLWMLGSIYQQAQYVLGTEHLALTWLREGQPGINGRKPLDLLSTCIGVDAVCDLLGQIDSCTYV